MTTAAFQTAIASAAEAGVAQIEVAVQAVAGRAADPFDVGAVVFFFAALSFALYCGIANAIVAADNRRPPPDPNERVSS